MLATWAHTLTHDQPLVTLLLVCCAGRGRQKLMLTLCAAPIKPPVGSSREQGRSAPSFGDLR